MNITPFLDALEQRLNEYKERNNFTYFAKYEVIYTEGKKFFKVFRQEVAHGGTKYSSIVAFIDKATGDIFKPSGCNAPAKHARGNVLSAQHGMEAIDESGFVRYLR